MTEQTDPPTGPSIWVTVPPPVWALLFLLAGWGLGAILDLEPVLRSAPAGAGLVLSGFILVSWGRRTFARAGAEIFPASPKNSVLVTGGPFRFTRNPMYLGLFILVTGLSLLIGTLSALAAAAVFLLWANVVSIPYEEEKMERQFGDVYRDYKKRVRRWI